MKQVVLRLVGVALAGLALGCPQPHTNSPSAADAHADAPTHEQAPAHAGAPHWTYEGEHGPERWGDLAPEFALAKEGKEQSPIDLAGAEGAPLPPIEFVHAPTAAKVVDNGHTIKVALAPGCTAEIGGVVYELLQFHFHHPSEHTVEGKAYPAEVHLVHRTPPAEAWAWSACSSSPARRTRSSTSCGARCRPRSGSRVTSAPSTRGPSSPRTGPTSTTRAR